jgi:multidrug efflux pump subunit AcrA (membrane-fusion protein)
MSTEGRSAISFARFRIRLTRPDAARPQGLLVAHSRLPVLIGGLGFIVWRIHTNQQLSAQNSANQAAALYSRPIPVQVAAAEQKPMPIFLTALGTVTPYMSVTVKARVSGELEPVKFTEGQQVHQGQTIMVIDPKPYQAALDQAKGNLLHDEALLKNAQAEYARYKALFEAGVTSKETLDADEARRASTRAPSPPTRPPLRPPSFSSTGAPSSHPLTAASGCASSIPATSSPPTPPTW